MYVHVERKRSMRRGVHTFVYMREKRVYVCVDGKGKHACVYCVVFVWLAGDMDMCACPGLRAWDVCVWSCSHNQSRHLSALTHAFANTNTQT